jgi:DNA-binding FadR family transcriptional regulator
MQSPPRPRARVASALRAAITSGLLPPGSPLPTVRQLARTESVSAFTTAEVYNTLVAGGLVEARRGTGHFVACLFTGTAGASALTRDQGPGSRRCTMEAASRGRRQLDSFRGRRRLAAGGLAVRRRHPRRASDEHASISCRLSRNVSCANGYWSTHVNL